jgi:hypothetical protein
MRRYLVVANQTLGGDRLIQEVRKRMRRESSVFWVLVPATKPAHFAQPASGVSFPFRMDASGYRSAAILASESGADSGDALARQRLDMELQRLHEAGAEADGEVGDPNAFKAISNTLKDQQFDEIILSTLPHTHSRWLRQDLLGQMKKKVQLPIAHIVAG